MRITRRALLGAASLIPLGVDAATVRRSVAPQRTGAGPGQLRTTLTFVNDGSGTAPASVPTDWFGVNFKDGDIPSGTFFTLQLADTTPQPFSSGGESYYPSGAMMHANVRLKPTFALTTGASQAVEAWSGGTAPSASGRTLATDLYGQGLQIRATISTASPQAAPGGNAFWVAQVDAAHVIKTETWADGGAGLGVALWMSFYQANSSFVITGSAHGQFMCKLYVFLTNDGSNNLGGMHLCAVLCQPKYNNDTPAKNTIALTAATYHVGSTTISWPLNQTPFTFTQDGGDSNRMQTASYGKTCACVVSGLSGSSLSAAQLYFLVPGSSATQFYLTTFSNLSGFAPGPVGSGTLTPVIPVMPFQRTYGLDSAANWVYLQGSGSIAASSIQPWRIKFDPTYFRNTRLIPPFDTTKIGTVPDAPSGFPTWYNSTWIDTNCGLNDQGLVGNSDSGVGAFVLNRDAAADFFNQTTTSRNNTKFTAYAQGKLSVDLRDATTLTPVNIIEAPTTNTYTGFPASVSTTMSFVSYGTSSHGFTEPPSTAGCYIFEGNGTRHYLEMTYYNYLVLGRPELWDAQASMGWRAGVSVEEGPDRNATAIDVDYGNQYWSQELRGTGHIIAALCLSAVVAPGKTTGSPLAPDGTNSVKMLRDWVSKIAKLQVDQMNPAISGSFANRNSFAGTASYWSLMHASLKTIQENSSWQLGHLMQGLLVGYGVLADTNMRTWLNYIYAGKLYQFANAGSWAQFSYYERNTTSGSGGSTTLISDITQYGMWGMHNSVTSWTLAGDATFGTHFSGSMIGPYTMSEGDGQFFAPANSGNVPGGVTGTHNFRIKAGSLHLISGPPNPSYKFDLEDLANLGVTVVPTSNGNTAASSVFMHPYIYPTPATPGVTGDATMQYGFSFMWYGYRWGTFLGLTVDSSILSNVNTIATTDNIFNFAIYDTAKYCIASS